MNTFNILLAALGGLVLLLALVSRRLSSSALSLPVVALLLGMLAGPQALGLLDPRDIGGDALVLERAARIALGIGLVGVALRIPPDFPRREWRSMAVLLGAGMPLTWAISALLAFLILGLPLWPALLVGAIVTPTDPVAASPIVTGELAENNVPERIRHALSFESGVNDGLGYLFVLLPLLMLERPAGEALSHWLLRTLPMDVIGAAAVGLAIGWAAGRLLEFSLRRGFIGTEWRLAYTVALALLAVGIGKLIGGDEVLLAFAAGMAFTRATAPATSDDAQRLQETVNVFFGTPMFALIGLTIPWTGWQALGWRGVALAVALLLLRRVPVILLLRPFLPWLRTLPETLFVGWFGPVAVSAVYYAALADRRLAEPAVWHVVSLAACVSVIGQGTSAAPFTRWFGCVERGRGPPSRQG
ncbi:MAG: cation:proton antiporter domain-containing protein [Burkholderiaceae bacterium]